MKKRGRLSHRRASPVQLTRVKTATRVSNGKPPKERRAGQLCAPQFDKASQTKRKSEMKLKKCTCWKVHKVLGEGVSRLLRAGLS